MSRHFLVLFEHRALAKKRGARLSEFLLCDAGRPNHRMRIHVCSAGAIFLTSLGFGGLANADPSTLAPEVGYNYGEQETARSAAMGGALRAIGNGVTALYLNPANMAVTRVYHLAALAQIWPEARRQTYGAAAVDSVTGKVAGGVSGNYGSLDPDGVSRKWTDARVALAVPLSDRFYAGVSGKYLKLRQTGSAHPGLGLPNSLASAGLPDNAIVDGFSFDAGITIKPSDALYIGVVGSNLTGTSTGVRPLTLGGGIGVGTNDVTAEADVVADFTSYTNALGSSQTKWRVMAGFEYLAGDHFPLRIGYRYDQGQSAHWIGGGAGYVDPQFSIEFAIRHTVSAGDPFGPATMFVIDLQYFVESTGLTKSPGDGSE